MTWYEKVLMALFIRIGMYWFTGVDLELDKDSNVISMKFAKRKVLKYVWSCSDYVQHEHRWRWTAEICGIYQEVLHALQK